MSTRAARCIRAVLACAFATMALPGLAACQSTRAGEQAWDESFTPPASLDTDRVHLEPLAPEHAERDHAAAMGSREHLRRSLHWGSWPRDDMTVEQNRGDLERHWDEFVKREAYAYTVMRPDESLCVGCIYLDPNERSPRTAQLAYWVVEDGIEAGLDEHLLAAVLAWIELEWPIDEVVVKVHIENERGLDVAAELDLERLHVSREDHVTYAWRR